MKYQFRAIVLVLLIGIILLGCANGQPARYPYYTGVKNPRVIDHGAQAHNRDNVVQAEPKSSPKSANPRYQSLPKSKPIQASTPANRYGYPLPTIKKQTGVYYRVQRGDTLYSIAWQYGYDVRDIAYWNRLRPPYTIYPQQKIRIKPRIVKSATKPASMGKKSSPKKASKKKTKWTPKKKKTSTRPRKISWQWPTKGKIIAKYSARESGKKGLDIAGKKGQPVYSAAGGEIVYSGSGLRGYGKLVIIKHNETFFSAYAHNRRLFVKEQQRVKKGQHIADMGSSEAKQAMLHFEVRRNGKPVDPLRYLPRR